MTRIEDKMEKINQIKK